MPHLPPPRLVVPNSFERHAPQRLVRYAEVCDACGGVDTFRVYVVIRGVTYVRCKKCGRHGTRTTILRK